MSFRKINILNLGVAYSLLQMNFYIPILILFLKSKVLSMAEIGIVLSFYTIGTFVFEIPTGMFADNYGKRNCLLLGCISKIIGVFLLYSFSSILGLILAQLFIAFADTTQTGSIESLLYENLEDGSQSSGFTRKYGLMGYWGSICLGISYIAGGLLYSIKPAFVFSLAIVIIIVSALIFLCMPDDHQKNKTCDTHSTSKFIESLFQNVVRKNILGYFLFGCMIEAFFMLIYFEFFQIYLKEVGFDIKYFGFIYALLTIPVAFGSKYSYRVKNPSNYIKYTVPLIYAASVLSLITSFKIVTLISFIIIRFAWGMFSNLFISSVSNKPEYQNVRASIISFINLLCGVYAALLYLLFGLIYDHLGMQGTTCLILICFAIIYFAQSYFMQKSIMRQEPQGLASNELKLDGRPFL